MNPARQAILSLLDKPDGAARVVLTAAAVVDAVGIRAAPGALLLAVARTPQSRIDLRLIAAGSPEQVQAHPSSSGATRIDAGPVVLIPALVNAHTHLDLTHMGARPYDPSSGFVGWVDMVRLGRETDGARIAASVRRGVELSRAGGVGLVGDIAGCPATGPTADAAVAMAGAGMGGTSYIEFFGMRRPRERGLERTEVVIESASEQCPGVTLGLGPHATNTVARPVLARVFEERSRPIAIHVAETVDEHRFIADGSGPQRELLERLGIWDDQILEDIGKGLSPIEHLAQIVGRSTSRAPVALVHANDCSDRDLDLLAGLRRAGRNVTIVYCPRASAYFGAADVFGPHRYLEMVNRGIPVALGTDSIINTEPRDASCRLTPWDDMRLLHARDGVAGMRLLEMATVVAARAIGGDPGLVSFNRVGPIAGVAAMDCRNVDQNDLISACLEHGQSPEFLLYNNQSCLAAT